MKFRMDKTLRFELDIAYEERKWEAGNRTKRQLIAEILRDFERTVMQCGT
jgi:hypothetical protein